MSLTLGACSSSTPEVVTTQESDASSSPTITDAPKAATSENTIPTEEAVITEASAETETSIDLPEMLDKPLLGYYIAARELNPHLAASNSDKDYSGIFYEPLATIDNEGSIYPILASEVPTAENGGLAEDGTSVTWKLREGVTWHDGIPFTAEDVVFTFNYVTNPDVASTSVNDYQAIKSVEALDDYTVEITFNSPNPAWFVPFTGLNGMILPEHIFKDYAGSNSREAPANTAPIGTGPYVVKNFIPQETLELEAYPGYWQAGKPYIKNVTLKDFGQQETTISAVLQTGEADLLAGVNIEWKILQEMLKSGKGNVALNVGSCVERILLNWADPNIADPVTGERASINNPHPIFSDIAVRKAVYIAIDRETIANELYGPKGVPTCNVLVFPTKYSSPNTSCDYNLQEAASILDEAGWVDGDSDGIREKDGVKLKVVFQTQTNAIRQQTQQIVKQALESIGFSVELTNIDGKSFFSSDPTDDNNIGHFYADMQEYNQCSFGADPGTYMLGWTCDQRSQASNNWSGRNLERYCNPEYDQLATQATLELDPEIRTELFWQMNDMLVNQDFSVIPIVTRAEMVAFAINLMGVEGTRMANDGVFWNIEDWYFTP